MRPEPAASDDALEPLADRKSRGVCGPSVRRGTHLRRQVKMAGLDLSKCDYLRCCVRQVQQIGHGESAVFCFRSI